MDIANWLRGLGLGQYEATFRDNAIEPDILADLTEADFEKLGIPLGHRKRLLKATRPWINCQQRRRRSL
jgi:SAM domain (Sterile alpha motif)